MHHKRKHRKNRRSGCLMCKFWKANGFPKHKAMKFSEYKKYLDAKKQIGKYEE